MTQTDRSVAPQKLAAQLLESYEAGSSFFFASPRRTLLARGTFATVPHVGGASSLERLPERVAAVLGDSRQADHDIPVAVGAVPFDGSVPAQLVVPMTIQRAGPLVFDDVAMPLPSQPARYTVQPVPEPSAYLDGVAQALKLMEHGPLRKVVLSRALHLSATAPIDLQRLLHNLARRNPSGYTFAVDLPSRGAAFPGEGRRTLIGASPELLVSRSGMQVLANPLAGSAARSPDPVEDQRRAHALLQSPKDLHEHAVVIDAVAEALRPFCKSLDVPAGPSLVNTQTMWHLSSRIVGELRDPSISSVTLALAMHPTPAVCGYPTELAHAAIGDIEPFERGYYTGAVGWCDVNGDGQWAVTIRCAEADEHSLRLFAGAGIVAGSKPESELAETEAKFRTMLQAMGLGQGVEVKS
ncbi:isochorismate synthase DhbC [Myxococcus stipitatus DSM 14675]|uniref:isochorismate synthase n=1 Tax=Myxococcus stipitatus (strain DSM 14675 / JCM 12634 / Mx s8) TaxID=1278073 RepID=L7UGN1_MYXSD|nr:isochorismate synthase DhbC [Myxococcus stipitatus]AGC45604.1 isochorismate synthase DhbC [Myxococcus stipitatus DSM 14675]